MISLHVGSSGTYPPPPGAPAVQLGATLFGQLSLAACAEWLWSGYPLRFPESEDRDERGWHWLGADADRSAATSWAPATATPATGRSPPSDVLRRNFWFCTFDDPSTIDLRHVIGVDHIMVEVDYPMATASGPTFSARSSEAWGHIPDRGDRARCAASTPPRCIAIRCPRLFCHDGVAMTVLP